MPRHYVSFASVLPENFSEKRTCDEHNSHEAASAPTSGRWEGNAAAGGKFSTRAAHSCEERIAAPLKSTLTCVAP